MYNNITETAAEAKRRETYLKFYGRIIPNLVNKYPEFKHEFGDQSISRMYHLMVTYSVFCNVMDVSHHLIMEKHFLNEPQGDAYTYNGATALACMKRTSLTLSNSFLKNIEDKRSVCTGTYLYNAAITDKNENFKYYPDSKQYSNHANLYIDRAINNTIYEHLTNTDLSIFCNLTAKMWQEEEFFKSIMLDAHYLFSRTNIPGYILDLYKDDSQVNKVVEKLENIMINEVKVVTSSW